MRVLIILLTLTYMTFSASPEANKHFESGLSAYQNNDLANAASYFSMAIKISPDYTEAHFYLSRIHLEKGDLDSALLNIEMVLSASPDWEDAYLQRGLIFKKKGWSPRAITDFEKVLSIDKNNAIALFQLGSLLIEKGSSQEINRGIQCLQSSLDLKPLESEPRLKLAEILEKTGEEKEALEHYRIVLNLKPDQNIKRKIEILELVAQGISHDEAQAIIDEAVKLPVKTESAPLLLVDKTPLATISDNISKAEYKGPAQEIKTQKMPKWPFILFGLSTATGIFFAWRYQNEQKLKNTRLSAIKAESMDKIKAIEMWEKTLQLNPDSMEAINKLADLYHEAGFTGKALKMCERIISKDPLNLKKNMRIMQYYAIEGEVAKLESTIEKVLKLSKNDPVVWLETAKFLMIAKEYEKAQSAFESLLRKNPELSQQICKEIESALSVGVSPDGMREFLADLFIKNGNAPFAVHQYEIILEKNPDNIPVMEKIAGTSLIAGLPQKAAKIYRELISLRPGNIDYHFTLAHIFDELNMHKEAVELLKNIGDRFPDTQDRIMETFAKIIAKKPSEPIIREVYIDILVAGGDLHNARKELESLVSLCPQSKQSVERLLRLQIADNDIDGALKTLEQVEKNFDAPAISESYRELIKKNPDDLKVPSAYAKFLQNSGEIERAISLYNSILSKNPNDLDAKFNLGALLISTDRISDAITELAPLGVHKNFRKRLIALYISTISSKDDPIIKLALAEAHIRDGAKQIAIDGLDEILEELAQDSSALRKAARIYEMADSFSGVLNALKMLVGLTRSEEDQNQLADAYKRAGDIAGARLQYEAILKRNPAHFQSAVKLSDLLTDIGEIDQASQIIDDSLRQSGKNDTLLEKKKSLEELKFERQIKEMGHYVEKWPNVESINAVIEISEKMVTVARSPELLKMIERKNRLSPDRVLMELGNLFFHTKKYDQAISEYQKLSRMDSKLRYEAIFQIAQCFIKKDFFDLALKQFEQLPFNEPLIPEKRKKEMLYEIASICEANDHYEEAANYLKQLTLIDINYLDTSKKLEKITEHITSNMTLLSGTFASPSPAKGMAVQNRYKNLKELGKGGMGIVYEALDTKLNRKVALKLLHSNLLNNEEALARFLREAKAAGSLSHPNIVGVFDIQEEGIIYISMELIEGDSLKAHIRKGLSIKSAVDYSLQTANGLAYAHQKGIIHRDIKPENIMITKDGIAKIADFGLARMEEAEAEVTVAGMVVGTRYFMSPEQIQGQNIDKKTDTYSLGISMYQMLTGKLPFETGDIAYQHIHIQAKPLTTYNSEIPEELERLVLGCMAKQSIDRPDDEKLIKGLQSILSAL